MRNQSVGLLLYNIRKLKVRDSRRVSSYPVLFLKLFWLYASYLRIFVGSKSLNKKKKKKKKKKRQNEKQMMGRFKLFGLGNEKF